MVLCVSITILQRERLIFSTGLNVNLWFLAQDDEFTTIRVLLKCITQVLLRRVIY